MLKIETFELVSIHDPAWGRVPIEALKRYADGGGKKEDLPVWPSGVEPPIVFTCRRLTRSQVFDHVETMSSDRSKYYRAFAFGVVKVAGGRFGAGWEPQSAQRELSHTVASDFITEEEFDYLDLSPREIQDIGGAIYCRSTDPKGSAPRYPRQPSSLDAWAANAPRSAERRGAPLSNDPPKVG